MKRHIRVFVIVFISVVFIIGSAGYFFLGTAAGTNFVLKTVLSHYLHPANVIIQKIEGNFLRGVTLTNIEINNLSGVTQESVVKIQTLSLSLTPFTPGGLTIKINNGRFISSLSDPILFYGDYQNGNLNFNLYSKQVSVQGVLGLFIKDGIFKEVSGRITDFDIYLKGGFSKPELSGEFILENLSWKRFSIAGCPGSFDLSLKNIKHSLELHGEIVINKGTVSGSKTAVVELSRSKILFSGDPKMPSFHLDGTSGVEGVTINLSLRGRRDNPKIKLTSEPPETEAKLLLMLATGKRWKGSEAMLSKGQLSADIAKDFVDYFVFSGSGKKIAQYFGLREISVEYDKEAIGVGVKKAVSGKVEASYGIKQSQEKEGDSVTTHKVGAEYKVSGDISLGVEKELKQKDSTGQINDISDADAAEEKVYLKYRKEF